MLLLKIIRACGFIVLSFTVGYLLFAAVPFYGNGIHLHTYKEIAGSFVDVKGYPPFTWLGGPGQATALYAAGLIRQVSVVLTPALVVSLAVQHQSLRRAEAAIWLVTVVLNVVALGLTWQMIPIINIWLAD